MLTKLLVAKMDHINHLKESLNKLDIQIAALLTAFNTAEETKVELLKELNRFEQDLDRFFIKNVEQKEVCNEQNIKQD